MAIFPSFFAFQADAKGFIEPCRWLAGLPACPVGPEASPAERLHVRRLGFHREHRGGQIYV